MGKSRFRFRTQYDPIEDIAVRTFTAIECLDESQTVQDAPGTDINEIVEQYGVTDGSVLPGAQGAIADPRFYGNFEDVPDLRTALDRLRAAEQAFAALPAPMRSRFNNDPIALHEWVSNPNNADEAVKIGLLTRSAAPPAPPSPPSGAPANSTNASQVT